MYINYSTIFLQDMRSLHGPEAAWEAGQEGQPLPVQGPSSWWVLGVRGPGPWALGSPRLVCLLSWASSQHSFCSSWADIMHSGCRRRWPLKAAHWGWNPCKEPGEGRPQSHPSSPRVQAGSSSPPSLCACFLLGQMNVGAKSPALSSPEGVMKEIWWKSSFSFPPICFGPYWVLPTRSLLPPLSTPLGLSHSLNN